MRNPYVTIQISTREQFVREPTKTAVEPSMSQSHEEIKTTLEAAPERKSGRAVFDEGRTVWEWQTATGVFERYVSEDQLSRLEASNLRLVDHSSQNMGRAIYGSPQVARKQFTVTERVFAPRAAENAARSARPESVGALRQFWRRLVPST
jgi:hypothetical protein